MCSRRGTPPQYLYRHVLPTGHGDNYFLESGITFSVTKAHQIFRSHFKLFIEAHRGFAQKAYLTKQIKPLHPVLHAVLYDIVRYR